MYENCGVAGDALDPRDHSNKVQDKQNDINGQRLFFNDLFLFWYWSITKI